MPFAWRGHTKSLTTRARPSPDLAVWLEYRSAPDIAPEAQLAQLEPWAGPAVDVDVGSLYDACWHGRTAEAREILRQALAPPRPTESDQY